MNRIFKLTRLGLLGAVIALCPTIYADTFVMGFGEDPTSNPQYNFYSKVYSAAFNTLGYEFSYILCPSKRCSKMANDGIIDGEPQRIRDYSSRYSNMVLVDEPIFFNRVIGLSKNAELSFSRLEDLKMLDLRIEYLRGSVWSKNNLIKATNKEHLSEVGSIEQGINKLQRGRTDIFFALEVPILKALHNKGLPTKDITIVGVAGQNISYPFIHKSHSGLAPALAQAIKDMKTSGEYWRILQEVMPYMQKLEKELTPLAIVNQ